MKILSKATQKGFTLIELLVVIGILGILAAALVATIDPFEQLKKADDSKIKNIVVEFQTANVRYFTTHGAFPWSDPGPAGGSLNTGCYTGVPTTFVEPLQLSDTRILACIGYIGAEDAAPAYSLIGDGELKSSFAINQADLAKVFISWDSTDPTNMVACYKPTSKSQKVSPETNYTNAGVAMSAGDKATCATSTDQTLCFWCTR